RDVPHHGVPRRGEGAEPPPERRGRHPEQGMESAMSTAVKITRVEDIRPGDHVTLTCNDTTVSGTVRDVTHGDATHLDIANLPCALSVGDGPWPLVSASRVVPDLPTEPGSVIANATIRGEEGHSAILDDYGDWRSLRPVGDGFLLHRSKDITAWEPGRIVPEGQS